MASYLGDSHCESVDVRINQFGHACPAVAYQVSCGLPVSVEPIRTPRIALPKTFAER